MSTFPNWKYDPKTTALVLIDVMNDFLAEGGKTYPLAKDVLVKFGTVKGNECAVGTK